MLKDINIKSHTGSYQVSFEKDLDFLASIFEDKSFFFVVDNKLSTIYRSEFKNIDSGRTVYIDANEKTKDLNIIPTLIKELTDKGIKRNHTIVAIGGGITQDITCFIASVLFRGIKWIFIPTTLLAQADSCIGSKSSINCSGVKNLVGNFYPPTKIHLSLTFLSSLKKPEILSGIGEILKVHMVKGIKEFEEIIERFDQLEDISILHVHIWNALLYKKELIEADEFDRGSRNIMNYGHTFGHAIEVANNFFIPHGIAVAMGMDMANLYAYKNGISKGTPYKVSSKKLKSLYSSNFKYLDIDTDVFFKTIKMDKKNEGGNISLILPTQEDERLKKIQVAADNQFKQFCHDFFTDIQNLKS